MILINQNKYTIIGADETGVGDYFSPLVATAVYIPLENIAIVKSFGVQDSKQLTDTRILEIAQQIRPYVDYKTNFLSQQGYNKLTANFNANELKMLLHLKNINALSAKYQVDFCVIDQFSTEKTIYQYQTKLVNSSFGLSPIEQQLILEQKAENKYLAVAAASILARAFLLKKMQKQNQQWNTIFPLGASNLVDQFGKEFVQLHGQKTLAQVAKISFKNTQKILN